MHDVKCEDVRDSSAEFALDLLDSIEKASVAAHLLRCPECRAEVESMEGVAARLVEVVPGTEPPLGFDRRVLERVGAAQPRRRRMWQWAAGVAAAAALIAGVSVALATAGSSHHPTAHLASAPLVDSGHRVGQIEVYGTQKPWVDMTVKGVTARGPIACQLITRDGTITTIGRFDLVNGSGEWGAPDRWGAASLSGARLVDATGRVVATASF